MSSSPSKRARLGIPAPEITQADNHLSVSQLDEGHASDIDQSDAQPTSAVPGASSNSGTRVVSNKKQLALKMLRKSAGVIPSLGSAVDNLADCFENLSVAHENERGFEELTSNIATALEGLETHSNQLNPIQMTKVVDRITEELNREIENISQKQGRKAANKYITIDQDIEDLMACYRRINALFRRLHSDAILSVWTITDRSLKAINHSMANTRLRELNPAMQARYDSSAASQVQRTGCTPNTRQMVLQGLRDWASDPHSAKIYWMNGMAGTGKTTIAYSLCTQLEAANQLAASFFCSRSLPDCRDVARIVPTIAYQLARFCGPFRDELCQALDSDPDLSDRDIQTQFERLLSEPMRRVADKVPDGLLVVVIDALDECSSSADALLILGAMIRFAGDLPLKFFVACRPENSLLETIASHGSLTRSLYHLHDIEQSVVQADIETYFKIELEAVRPSHEEIKRLVEQSGKLFIYAATIVRYTMNRTVSINHRTRLDVVLGIGSDMSRKPLDDLYTTILAAALDTTNMESWETKHVEAVLHMVVCAREPLTTGAIAYMLHMDNREEVRDGIKPLLSVVHVDEQSELIYTLHASFPNYMLDAARSGRFFCDKKKQSAYMVRRCFEIMEEMLRFNICGFESSFVFDEQVPNLLSRLSEAIPLHLFYACRYWMDHMLQAAMVDCPLTLLRDFLRHRVLFWMEVINVQHATRAGVQTLLSCHNWMKTTIISDDVCELCLDAQRFVAVVGANPVCKSTPHIYVSVLALWDKRAPMWNHYGAWTRGMVVGEGPAIENRDSAVLAVWRYTSAIFEIAISSDGNRVLSRSRDGSLCIWDTHSGDILMILLHEDSSPRCVTFSPDGACFASGSDDGTIYIWDTLTGRKVKGPLQGHTDTVWSVAYSPDGSRFTSSSQDYTILIWDALTGEVVAGPLKGHAGTVASVAYSPDGKRVASGSWDSTMCIWDAQTGQKLVGPITGHTDGVNCVAYSPDGSLIASGSADCTVRIWDARTGDSIMEPFHGHTNDILCVSYSPNGDRVVSGSYNYTIRVWDTKNGQTIASPFSGHTSWVSSVVFMPDGNRVVSCSEDQSICIWDAKALNASASTFDTHTGLILSLAFSRDSRYIASGSNDTTVRVWDTRTGQMIAGPLTGHTGGVNSVAFSPCGNCVASGSQDHTVCIWDVETGHSLVGPCKAHSGWVRSVVFSPDGRRVASGSNDCTIQVWDVQSGHAAPPPFTGHTKSVLSVAYSPDGERIASCSYDDTIRIWDAQTGEAVAGPFHHDARSVTYSSDGARILFRSDYTVSICDAFTGIVTIGPCEEHMDSVSSTALSSDDRYIISGSYDRTIQVWDANTGQKILGPLRAHTSSVTSVACSRTGYLIASGSSDCVIRIWDLDKLTSTSPQDSNWWTVNEDGWVVAHDLSPLLWVPPDLRLGLKWPQSLASIHRKGYCKLNFTNACLGIAWTKCYISE